MNQKIKGKTYEVLTLITDAMCSPAAVTADLYGYRWEIELGYSERKQYILVNCRLLRSRLSE